MCRSGVSVVNMDGDDDRFAKTGFFMAVSTRTSRNHSGSCNRNLKDSFLWQTEGELNQSIAPGVYEAPTELTRPHAIFSATGRKMRSKRPTPQASNQLVY